MAKTRSSRVGSALGHSRQAGRQPNATATDPVAIVADRYRNFVFPNRIREQRRSRGLQKLMALSDRLPDIPYIRLSKIERGEVVARVDELQQIARALDIAPLDLMIEPSDKAFDIAAWALPFQDGRAVPVEEERFAIQLAAALRVLRNADAALTIAKLEKDFRLPPVILSRLENAHKTFDRWNDATVAAVCRLFGVSDEPALRAKVADQYRRGDLNPAIARIVDSADRERRSRDRTAALLAELADTTAPSPPSAENRAARPPRTMPAVKASPGTPRALQVFGAPSVDGLIAPTLTDAVVEAPRNAGPRAFGLRVCRATLGAGLPAGAIVVADPDHPIKAGGLAAVRTDEGYRLVTVTFDRWGATKGYSVKPDLEIDLDTIAASDIVAVTAAFFS